MARAEEERGGPEPGDATDIWGGAGSGRNLSTQTNKECGGEQWQKILFDKLCSAEMITQLIDWGEKNINYDE